MELTVDKIFVHFAGDPTVGLSDYTITISDLDVLVDINDIDSITAIKNKFIEAFYLLYGERPVIQFDIEQI